MSKFSFIKRILSTSLALTLLSTSLFTGAKEVFAQENNGTMMQYFEWYLKNDGEHWNNLKDRSKALSDLGITALWLPPAYKGWSGNGDVGYGVYDLYDLGEFNQKGTIRTKYGTKDQYLAAISQAHKNGIQVYGDIVLNHKMGSDYNESVLVQEVASNNRYYNIGSPFMMDFPTGYNFPGRNGKYSSFTWNQSHFDGNDHYGKIYRIANKSWDENTERENGNYDYLMGADLDMQNPEVKSELNSWGKWYTDFASLDGYRIDAVKHIDSNFFKEWLSYQRSNSNKELFAVGEYWSTSRSTLESYLAATDYKMHLFDVPLHKMFIDASRSNGNYDMGRLIYDSLVAKHPALSVTFVDNHDSQPGQMLGPQVDNWFKPQAYTFILTRNTGYPCVFYGDYYGIDDPADSSHNVPSIKDKLDIIIKVRKDLAYGKQHDYFDHSDLVGWTREGDSEHTNSGLAALITDRLGGSKRMYVGLQNTGKTYYDITGNVSNRVVIDSTGHGNFSVNDGSYSIWVKENTNENSVNISFKVKNATTFYGQNVYIVGSTPELGSWDPSKAVKLNTYEGLYPTWTGTLSLPKNKSIEFKFIKKHDNNVIWESGSNRSYRTGESHSEYMSNWK